MRRIFVAAAVLSLTAALSTVVASPALAGSGPPGGGSVTCTTGSTCAIDLQHLIVVNGHSSFQGLTNSGVSVTPPPCLWIPEGDAITGSKYIINLYGSDPSKAPTGFQINQAVAKADQLLKAPVPGTWYWLPVNPNASQGGQQECLKLPAYYWAVPGGALPIYVPPKTVGQYLISGISKASVSSITLNPQGHSIVNLPTFVTARLSFPNGEQGNVSLRGNRLVISLTAQVGNQPAVTAWIASSPLTLETQDANVYQDCPAQGSGNAFQMGTRASMSAQNAVTIGEHIDCGVTYLSPSPGTFSLTAKVNWAAHWAIAPSIAAVGNLDGGNAVSGLTPSFLTKQVIVQEVQSSNGG